MVLSHTGLSSFAGGFIGVDVFFVLSGFLISGMLLEEMDRTGSIRLADFYSRRIRRLLPALLVMLGTVMWFTPRLLSDYEFREQTGSLIYAATWTSNFLFALSSNPYFAELRERDLFLHTWSLGIEEQFYLLWPILILALALFARSTASNFRKWVYFSLCLLAVGSFALTQYWTASSPLWAFYLMPSRIWEFALGALAYIWLFETGNDRQHRTIQPLLKSRWVYIGYGGLMLILGSAVAMGTDTAYPSYRAAIPALGTVLLLVAGELAPEQGASRLLAHPALVWLGDRSYSLYLWHWPVLNIGFAWGMQQYFSEVSLLVALSLLFAMTSYRWVEQPFRKFRLHQLSPALVNSLGILATGALITSCYFQKQIDPSTIATREIAAHHQTNASSHAIYRSECDSWITDAQVHPCVMGASNAPKTLVILGDSVGTQWASLLPEIYTSPEWKIVVFIKSACPIVDEEIFYSRIGKTYRVCSQWRNSVIEYLQHLHPEMILVGSSAFYNYSPSQWIEGTTRILSRLTSIARHVVIIAGTPKLSFHGPGCLDRETAKSGKTTPAPDMCSEPLIDRQPERVASFLEAAASRFHNTHLLNLNDLVCPREKCMAQQASGLTVFADQQHLTAQYVRAQAPLVARRMAAIVGQ